MLPSLLKKWESEGQYIHVGNRRVFVVEKGHREKPCVVFLHGFPTSSHDFEALIPHLLPDYRLIFHDHLGFGFSDKPTDYSYSLFEQADVALQIWQKLGVKSAHLVAHDYSTSVATELIARDVRGLLPIAFKSVTLSNGSMYIHLAQLTPSQRVGRMKWVEPLIPKVYGYRLFQAQMRRIFSHPQAVSDEILEAMWAGLKFNDGVSRVPDIQQYLDERSRFFNRWIGSLRDFQTPTQVLWGRLDPVAIPAIAEHVAQDLAQSTLTYLEGLGHYPMVENPEAFAQALLDYWQGLES